MVSIPSSQWLQFHLCLYRWDFACMQSCCLKSNSVRTTDVVAPTVFSTSMFSVNVLSSIIFFTCPVRFFKSFAQASWLPVLPNSISTRPQLSTYDLLFPHVCQARLLHFAHLEYLSIWGISTSHLWAQGLFSCSWRLSLPKKLDLVCLTGLLTYIPQFADPADHLPRLFLLCLDESLFTPQAFQNWWRFTHDPWTDHDIQSTRRYIKYLCAQWHMNSSRGNNSSKDNATKSISNEYTSGTISNRNELRHSPISVLQAYSVHNLYIPRLYS